jgi:hypothetical protein
MSSFSQVKHFVARIWRRREMERELDEEVREFFEIHVQRGMERGLSREDAARAARVQFEGAEQIKEKVREARVGASIEWRSEPMPLSSAWLTESC